jgi:hypothetical protein
MCHPSRFKQLRPSQPLEPAFRERPAPRVEVPRDRLSVRSADPEGVGAEALVADRLQILRVRVEDVLAADVARGVEEREAHADRDLEHAPLLAVGLTDERRVDRRQLLGVRQAFRVLAQVAQRAPEPLDLERRDVDQAGRGPARALERREQLVHRAELCLARDHSRLLQLVDECVQVHARAAGHVGRRGQDPERREPEREDGAELDDVAGALPHRELSRRALELTGDRGLRALDAADQLDGDPQQVLRRRLVQPRAPNEAGEEELRGLVHGAADERGGGAHDPLRERDEKARCAAHGLRARRLRPDGDPARQSKSVERQPGRVCIVRLRRVDRDTAGDGAQVRLDAPAGRDPDRNASDERVQREASVRGELRVAQVDGDPPEPRQHRSAAKRRCPALHVHAVEDRHERDLVALGVSA